MTAPIDNPALGTDLLYGPVSGTTGTITYSTVGRIESLDGPSREKGTRETSHLKTTTGKTFKGTMLDNGEVSGSVQYDPKSTAHSAMETIFLDKTHNYLFQIALNDAAGTTISFEGVLTKWGAIKGVEIEANLMADFAIKVSGDITIT